MATPKIIASPHATALSGELKTISSSRIKAHTATTPAKVTNRLARSFIASPSVPPYFSILLFIFCNSGCVNPERNKASSVTFISSRPLSSRSVFPIADCASNHTDELYSNPYDVCPMYQISGNTIEAIKPREWYKQQAERSDFIRLSEGSYPIRMLVYLSERERSAGRASMSCPGTFPLFTCLRSHKAVLR